MLRTRNPFVSFCVLLCSCYEKGRVPIRLYHLHPWRSSRYTMGRSPYRSPDYSLMALNTTGAASIRTVIEDLRTAGESKRVLVNR